jgi:radical SAM superfamily enzyme YgiQ (UPF0313 family)
MYKGERFKLRHFEDVVSDLKEARSYYTHVGRIFLADGDALCMTAGKFLRILDATRALFPECTRVGTYSRASHILRKSDAELSSLRDAGLGIIYIGAESGSAEVLRRINKGETPGEITEAVRKAESLGLATSVTFISGLGGRELMEEHATETGRMISDMGASYIGLLTLVLSPEAPLFDDEKAGRFVQLSPAETIDELEIILDSADCSSESVFRSNHASNWLVLKGVLPQDKDMLLRQVRHAKSNVGAFSAHRLRGL